MNVDVSTEVVVGQPLEKVFEFSSDPDNVPEWYVNIKSVEWETERPLCIGSRIAFVAHFLGRRLVYTYEVVEFVPGERLVMRTSQGPFPMETTYGWREEAPGRTRMTLRNRGTPSGFSRLMAPLMKRAVSSANRKDLIRFKEILESRA